VTSRLDRLAAFYAARNPSATEPNP